MASQTLRKLVGDAKLLAVLSSLKNQHVVKRTITEKQTGAFLSEPKKVSLGVIRVILTVIPGLFIGAGISKGIANFLEENDLFVPDDDDDDDDD